MEILIQPVLQQARRLRLSMHLRFLRAQPSALEGRRARSGPADPNQEGAVGTMSYVIIHRPYEYLEPMIRQLFCHAPDVDVLVDRRRGERRNRIRPPWEGEERRMRGDRRAPSPMIDVLINIVP